MALRSGWMPFDTVLGKLTARYPLTRLTWISVVAALATIAIKTLAWVVTDSVGFLSDAAESVSGGFAYRSHGEKTK